MHDSGGAHCALLDRLPAELRNEIYELAFTTDQNENETIDLTTTPPPSKTLLQTCRQINNEARALYKTAYRQFWEANIFTIDASTDDAGFRKLCFEDDVKEEDWAHMKEIRITSFSNGNLYEEHVYTREHGVWEIHVRYLHTRAHVLCYGVVDFKDYVFLSIGSSLHRHQYLEQAKEHLVANGCARAPMKGAMRLVCRELKHLYNRLRWD